MPKRPTGQKNAVLQMGRTRHQRQADDLMVAHGFHFERRTGHGSNLYRHPDGRSETVNSTPRNPANEYAMLKRRVRGTTPTREIDVSTTTESAVNPVTLYVSMSDPFLLKTPNNRLELRARQQALAGWVRRVVDRHGPVLSSDLYNAAVQMGFSDRQVRYARIDAGVIGYVVAGEGKGKGRGSAPAWVALPHQLPDNASVIGRPRVEAEPNGVSSVREEGEVEGAVVGHDPVPEPEGETFRQELAPVAPAERELALETVAAAITGVPASTPAKISSENRDGVAAAAQLLLGELGVKMPGEEARQAVRAAMHEIKMAGAACDGAYIALSAALESLQ